MFNTKYVMNKGLSVAEHEEMQMLSEYASRGWKLDKCVFLGYKLKKAKPENLQYDLDYRKNPDKDYFLYFEEAGWNKVCSVGNTIHIFSAPEGTKLIYTDNDTEIEKYISIYESTKKVAIPSSVCSILLMFLILLAKYNYLPDICRIRFAVILMPTLAITIFTTIPCINYYSKINELQKVSNSNKKHKISRFAIIMLISFIFLLILFGLKIISISMAIFSFIWLIIILLSVSRNSVK
ncbi:DUF2812 domain-containing protein [Clostridium uliginosum]|uniref:DUF2812 domain-containing protein n=1 Tax=Clostridium uliginosum TaxID=119641 RepID=A0A1I1MRY1_9CLOT|nr:DUF2812 domain-containing protein [Clostridium uliginosum]SFC87876.1 Protein of unknown function [Clostridium uliginosum]